MRQLIDDLVTKDLREPDRWLTELVAKYRLVLRAITPTVG